MQFRNQKHHINIQRGFTLVEMLVAVSIFSIVMTISVGTLIVLMNASAVAQGSQVTMSNLSFALDTMSRNIRTGYDYYCTNTVQSTLQTGVQDCASGARMLIFTDGETGSRTAYLYDTIEKGIFQKVGTGSWVRLTSDTIVIADAEFTVFGALPRDSETLEPEQPHVLMRLKGYSTDVGSMPVAPFYIETFVTSRSIDV